MIAQNIFHLKKDWPLKEIGAVPFLAFLGGALMACGDPNVDIVKEAKLDGAITLEQALKNQNLCDDIEWNSEKKDTGRTYVYYNCYAYSFNNYFVDELGANESPDKIHEKMVFEVSPEEDWFKPEAMYLTAYIDDKKVLEAEHTVKSLIRGRLESMYKKERTREEYLNDQWMLHSPGYNIDF